MGKNSQTVIKEEDEMFSIGNDELDECGALGDNIKCKRCGEEHPVEYGKEVLPDGTEKPSKTLAFVKCGDKTYLVGVNGKDITNRGR